MRGGCVEGPDAGGVVGAAGCEVADVRGEEDAGNVGAVSGEFADGDDGGCVVALDHAPDVDVALCGILGGFHVGCEEEKAYSVVACADHAAI